MEELRGESISLLATNLTLFVLPQLAVTYIIMISQSNASCIYTMLLFTSIFVFNTLTSRDIISSSSGCGVDVRTGIGIDLILPSALIDYK